MNQHYSEADLLETYYTQPGESMPVMMHLANCEECAARYEGLERKLRSLAACPHDDKPDTFWSRQRHGIMRSIDRRSHIRVPLPRLAAAAVLAVVAGAGAWTLRDRPEEPVPQPAIAAEASVTVPAPVPADPWESEQLSDFQSIVAWESWEETNGGKS